MKRSPDWSIYELGENAWNDFAKGDDHVVSTQGCEVLKLSKAPCDANKKSRHEADFAKSTQDSLKGCHFSHGNDSPAVDNLIPVENDHNSAAKDLTFHEWPDIDNFDDVERMFRYCDSTFGQSHVNFVNELSWLPSSSNTIDGSEASCASVLLSSCPEQGLLNDALEESYANTNYFPKFGPPSTDVTSNSVGCHSSNGPPGNDAEVKGISVSKQQIGSQYSLEDDIMQRWVDEKVPTSAATTQTYSCQCFSEQNHFSGSPSSSYMHNFNSHAQVDYSFPADWIPQTQSMSSSNKFENETHPMTSFEQFAPHAPRSMEHFPDQSSMPPAMQPDIRMEKLPKKQSYASLLMEDCHHDAVTNKSALLKKCIKSQQATASGRIQELGRVPIAGINSTVVQQNSLVTSVSSDDISAEAMGIQQLWHVMGQLDVKTKLCIRDSLYRLAWSTKRRNIFGRSNCSSESMNATEILGAEAWNECAETNAETETNPIDRSIAHLLFQMPLASAGRYS